MRKNDGRKHNFNLGNSILLQYIYIKAANDIRTRSTHFIVEELRVGAKQYKIILDELANAQHKSQLALFCADIIPPLKRKSVASC